MLLSTYLLTMAVNRRQHRWWVAYGVATLLSFYAHYYTAFLVAAHGLWVMWQHREQFWIFLLNAGGAFLLFLPWAVYDNFVLSSGRSLALGGNFPLSGRWQQFAYGAWMHPGPDDICRMGVGWSCVVAGRGGRCVDAAKT